jgi:recombination protein RecT
MEENKMTQTAQLPAKAPQTASQSFVNRVLREYATTSFGEATKLNDAQRRIIQGYFVVIDRTLKAAEEERLRKNAGNRDAKYNNDLPYEWNKVNLTDLALDAVHYARLGLDMQEKNHLFPIPYANKKQGRYDITFMLGYSGIQYIAEKYAMYPPKSVTIEVVYSTDVFMPIKKSSRNPIETYEFEITNPFDRGDILGGFGYIEYDEPARNTLVMMGKKDIQKRKPKYASANFWGGKSKVWENGKQIEVEMEGWYDEMVRKSLIREVYSGKHIPRDPSKIDDDYQHLREREVAYAEVEVANDAIENANTIPITLPVGNPAHVIEQDTAAAAEQTKEPVEQNATFPDNGLPIEAVDF